MPRRSLESSPVSQGSPPLATPTPQRRRVANAPRCAELVPAAILQTVADRLAIQVDAYTWRRYGLIRPFLLRGPIRALNIGTGGGVETLRLLRRGNRVTTIEIDPDAARRTRARAERCGFRDCYEGKVGHILEVDLEGPFHFVLMGEVLEHIQDDFAALRRVAGWLVPGGRLVLSTPTSSFGRVAGRRPVDP